MQRSRKQVTFQVVLKSCLVDLKIKKASLPSINELYTQPGHLLDQESSSHGAPIASGANFNKLHGLRLASEGKPLLNTSYLENPRKIALNSTIQQHISIIKNGQEYELIMLKFHQGQYTGYTVNTFTVKSICCQRESSKSFTNYSPNSSVRNTAQN